MYTRFKSQKSGIKVGINTIANSTRSRVVVSPSSPPFHQTNSFSGSNTIFEDDLTSNPITTTASIVVVTDADKMENQNKDDQFHSSNKKNLIPFEFVSGSNKKTTSNNVKKSSDKNSNERSKLLENKQVDSDEIVDATSINYVKSMWEKYVNELGKQDGPLMTEDDDESQYDHLKGFVAFDMEQWWAERSISSMINDKKTSELNSNANFINDKNKNCDSTSSIDDNDSKDIKNIKNNINNCDGLTSALITATTKTKPSFANQDNFIEMSKKYNNSKYSFNLTVSKHIQNNAQLCFS